METKLNLEQETIDALQELIKVNIDSTKVLREAADSIDHEAMSSLFRLISNARESHAVELKSYVRANTEEPEDEGSLGGAIRRKWLDLRSSINSGDPKVVLIEAERAEDSIKDSYEDLLVKTAGSAMNDILMRQFREVKKHHDQIRDLRDAAQAA